MSAYMSRLSQVKGDIIDIPIWRAAYGL